MFFDSARRQVCEVKPLRTNTPMHALTTLNDTTYVEAARALADSLLNTEKENAARLKMAGRRVLGRSPTTEELTIWQRSLDRSSKAFAAAPESAREFLSHGEFKSKVPVPPVTHAAWTALCLNLLNIDETLNRE